MALAEAPSLPMLWITDPLCNAPFPFVPISRFVPANPIRRSNRELYFEHYRPAGCFVVSKGEYILVAQPE